MQNVLRDYWQLTRPRIVGLVLFTIVVSVLAAARSVPPWPVLVHALLGNALVIVGAIALNQRLEHRRDAQMPRTAPRPLPAGRLSGAEVTRFGLVTSAAGMLYLGLLVNRPTVILAAVSWVIYVWIYTPIKPFSAWQTPIGAVAGAMPTLLGAAAADALGNVTAAALFGIVYFWQFPHSMAIAWLYRRQFADARFQVATVVDPSGRTAAWLAVLGAVLLLPVSLAPTIGGGLGWGYGVLALTVGTCYLVASLVFFVRTSDQAARLLLRVSVVHLVVLLAALTAAALG